MPWIFLRREDVAGSHNDTRILVATALQPFVSFVIGVMLTFGGDERWMGRPLELIMVNDAAPIVAGVLFTIFSIVLAWGLIFDKGCTVWISGWLCGSLCSVMGSSAFIVLIEHVHSGNSVSFLLWASLAINFIMLAQSRIKHM